MAIDAPSETLSKLDVIRRQLRTAIRMFFADGDTVSSYTLAAAVEGVLGGLLKRQGKPHPFRESDVIRPGMERAFNDLLNRPQNFFKHASSDPNEVLVFPTMALEYVLFECVVLYKMYRGRHLREGWLFYVWFGLHHPDTVSGEPLQGFLEELKTQAPTLATRKTAYLEAIDRPSLYPTAHALD
jgi:hypothetical protein